MLLDITHTHIYIYIYIAIGKFLLVVVDYGVVYTTIE